MTPKQFKALENKSIKMQRKLVELSKDPKKTSSLLWQIIEAELELEAECNF